MPNRFDQRPADCGLYRAANEHDACGVGLVADLNNRPSHDIVEKGMQILMRLMHRGAAGGDPETGDGAGLLLGMPYEFFRREIGSALPVAGRYAVAMLFGGDEQEEKIENLIRAKGCRIIAWREVPVNHDAIGHVARESCPRIRQIFVEADNFNSESDFAAQLFAIRRTIEKNIPECYICSFSNRSIVYKGLLLATQMKNFYLDLADRDFKSPLALVHQRYSTNTFPTWQLAHPFRYLAHNGEINTIRGNLNQLRGREHRLSSDKLDLPAILPLIAGNQSDSASLDNMFELLHMAGRDMCHAMFMLMPQAWGKKYHLGCDVRAFYEYHSALLEPWDGPATVAFSDGRNAGVILDRNGLRPARYTLTRDNLFVLASETGVLDITGADVIAKGRLRPGEMLYCDLDNHRLVRDAELKNCAARRLPYRRWVDENRISVHGLFSDIAPAEEMPELIARQNFFGYTREDVDIIIRTMAESGHEPTGSMGNDAALAVLSNRPQPLFNYFKQQFAQVTNPPIDPIREELVMSLTTYIGNNPDILREGPQHARIIKLNRPVLTDDELNRLKSLKFHDDSFTAATISIGFSGNLADALENLEQEACALVASGINIIILSDRHLGDNELPIPSLLAVSAVNRALSDENMRCATGLIIESGEVREVMHFALLLGFGATAVAPYLALATVASLGAPRIQATENYINAVDKGLLKIMSKMGISTLRSYRSAQLFEAVGLAPELINCYFPGTVSRIGGLNIAAVEREVRMQAASGGDGAAKLPDSGIYKFRTGGESHMWTPPAIATFRQAVQHNDPLKYREFAAMIDDQSRTMCTLRSVMAFSPAAPVSLDEVEPAEKIMRRFVSGAMSLGSLSPEAHEAIAIAMNNIGAMSNCGEGGEAPARSVIAADGINRASAIRQIASGRFGVTIEYLRNGKELQIKMAQGAKPGEGGQLPGDKVDDFIASIRHSTPHVTLISPPPHHDIYSIEDLAQLIHDLRSANPEARISVKLVSENGVGTVAAGVVKAHADVILISGHDGGTGAAPLTGIKHAGLPWELGLAEAQQTLTLNNLRDRVRLQVDGQLKTGRDVIVGALLGAEEFGFATSILVCLGCVMMRKCHDNSCPAGVATQDPEKRKCFRGKPEYIENYLRFVAEEVREYLAALGLRSLDEAVGRSDLLCRNPEIDMWKIRDLDYSAMLHTVAGAARQSSGVVAPHEIDYDRRELIPFLQDAIKRAKPTVLERRISNVDRSAGTGLSGEIAALHTGTGLPPDTIHLKFDGCAGQSFGAFLISGVTLELTGEANDFVGKGLSGGIIVIRPPLDATFDAAANVIAGNVIGYGGTSGKIFINGQAGERFGIRNSGMTMVVEGVGDHGCEYMTGGRVAVLGGTGVNFAAGMTGGIAYVLDENNDFDLKCNSNSVDLETVGSNSADEAELQQLLRDHIAATGSVKARDILADWVNYRSRFVKVMPDEYRRVMANGKGENRK